MAVSNQDFDKLVPREFHAPQQTSDLDNWGRIERSLSGLQTAPAFPMRRFRFLDTQQRIRSASVRPRCTNSRKGFLVPFALRGPRTARETLLHPSEQWPRRVATLDCVVQAG